MDHTIVIYILIAVLCLVIIILAWCIRALYTANTAMDEDLTDVETIIRAHESQLAGIDAVITNAVGNTRDPKPLGDAENALATALATWQALSACRDEQGRG